MIDFVDSCCQLGILRLRRPVGEQCAGCWLLGAEDTLCYHCFHMGMHEFTQGLRPVWELRRLLLEDGPDLAAAAERARGWGTAGMTWCALRLCQVCFPGVVGDEGLVAARAAQRLNRPNS